MVRKFVVLSFVVLFFAGCSRSYSAKHLSSLKIFEERYQSVLNSSELSWQTKQQLRLLFLDKQYKKDPLSVIAKLYDEAYALKDKKMMKAAAELSLLNARKKYAKDRVTSTALYINAAELAYDYLFLDDSFASENVLIPSYRFMVEIYNRSVSRLIEIRSKHDNPWSDNILRTVGDRTYELAIEKQGSLMWDPGIFDQLELANKLRIKGLRNEYREKGLGAPLVGTVQTPGEHPELGSKLPPQGVTFPVTAVLTFGEKDHLGGKLHRKGKLSFYDSMQTVNVMIEGNQVPLETDYSTPLGLMLARIENTGGGLRGMFHSDEYAKIAGIYMLEPISLKKIPVVMVHGLMSSPKTWIEMFNDLRGQKEIRENYQFWFFKYPTGLPVAYSSSILRKQLQEIYSKYDPERKSSYFNNMLLIGHSMGGLLSRTMVQDSKDIFWNSIFAEPLDTISISDEDKQALKDIMFFEKNDSVKRVIFISTPHRGSDIADKWFTKIGSQMIHLPATVTGLTQNIISVGQEKVAVDISQYSKHVPNSLDNLSPSSGFIKVINKLPLANDVPYHSIIGVRKSKTGPNSSDGIVPYWSSHMDIAASEVLVPSGHSAHMHPLAIAEVKRVLLLHLKKSEIKLIEEWK